MTDAPIFPRECAGYLDIFSLTLASKLSYHTFETQLVTFQGSNRFPEQVFGMLISSIDPSDVDLFPLNGNIVRLENRFDGFRNLGADSIA